MAFAGRCGAAEGVGSAPFKLLKARTTLILLWLASTRLGLGADMWELAVLAHDGSLPYYALAGTLLGEAGGRGEVLQGDKGSEEEQDGAARTRIVKEFFTPLYVAWGGQTDNDRAAALLPFLGGAAAWAGLTVNLEPKIRALVADGDVSGAVLADALALAPAVPFYHSLRRTSAILQAKACVAIAFELSCRHCPYGINRIAERIPRSHIGINFNRPALRMTI